MNQIDKKQTQSVYHYFILFLLALSLTILQISCSIGPDYIKPVVILETNQNSEKLITNKSPLIQKKWWEIYQDQTLNSLEEQINVSNQTLLQLEAKYRQAQAMIDQAKSSYYPTLSLGASYSRSYDTQISGLPPSGKNSFNFPITISWEFDLWGKTRKGVEASQANANASRLDIESMTLLIQAQLAQYYFQLRALDQDKKILDSSVEAYQKNYDMTNNRYTNGVSSKGDVLQSETQLKTTQAQSIDLEIQRAQTVHAIAVLLGKPAYHFFILPAEFTINPPFVPISLPSELLKRRPDIIAAEERLKSANAQIGVTRTNFFPSITLGGSAGIKNQYPENLSDSKSRYYQVSPALSFTFFDGGLRNSLSNQAKAVFDANLAAYQQTILTAFQEVEDNLNALNILEKEAVVMDKAVKAAEQSLLFITNQYKAGTVSFFNVILAQSTFLSNKRTANDILSKRMIASANLIKALGGGWDLDKISQK